ncbi:MAG: TMEM175 family protein [Chitinophagaceae bacterium]
MSELKFNKGRMEAFSDGVIAIIITIMVLEMKVPHEATIAALQPMIPVFISYILSFMYVGIYWNNHHHMMQAVKNIDGSILVANLLLLFTLSIIPFFTAWMGENHFSQIPVMFYGIILLMNAIAYSILAMRLIKIHGKDSLLALAFGNDQKGKMSVAIYIVAIILSFFNSWISLALYFIVAGIWFIPDKRIESRIAGDNG